MVDSTKLLSLINSNTMFHNTTLICFGLGTPLLNRTLTTPLESFKMSTDVLIEYFSILSQSTDKYGPKTVLLFEIGSFYEIYDKTNEIDVLCNIMNIQRTRKDKRASESLESSPYMCGFPNHALQKFLRILTQNNYVVVVYNQKDHPTNKNKKARVLDNVYSGATLIEDAPIETQLILSIYLEFDCNNKLSDVNICHVDVTTGKSECIILPRINFSEISKIVEIYNPRQIVINTDGCKYSKEEVVEKLHLAHRHLVHIYLENVHKDLNKLSYQNTYLSKVFVSSMITAIEYLNLERYPSMIVSYILLLNFIYEHNQTFLVKLTKPKIINIGDTVDLSQNAIHQLNLVPSSTFNSKSSLFNVINKTSTPGGQRLLKERLLHPITDVQELEYRYSNIAKMSKVIDEYEIQLGNIRDLERLHRKIHLNKFQPSEFPLLDESYVAVAHIMGLSTRDHIYDSLLGQEWVTKLYALHKFYHEHLIMENVAKYNLDDDFTLPIFQTGHYSDLDQLYTQNKTYRDALKELAKNLAMSIGDDSPLRYESTSVQGYYLVTTKKKKSLLAQVDPTLEFKDQSSNVKVSSPTIHRLSTQILETQSALNQLTKQKYTIFLYQISSEYADVLEHITIFTNNVDVCKSIAKVSIANKYCRPVIALEGEKSFIQAESLRHPIIEVIDTTSKYIPNDVSIGREMDGMLLYGLNSSGKSTYGRSCGMAIVLAMCGFYVPAQSFVYKPYKKIMTKIAIQDDLFKGKSTFINEMLELKNILEYADSMTLVIADELCSGTEYSSALSIVASTVIELATRKASFIFMTHFHELTEISGIKELSNVKVFHTDVAIDDRNGLTFNRLLKPGKCPVKYGIEIAAHMSLDVSFITRAMKIRSSYDEDNKLSPCKPSKYNSNVYVDQCKVCGGTKDLVVHHIVAQREFVEGHCIPYRKNIEHNLVVLCESCHNKVHRTKDLVINGYIQTSQGLRLDYYDTEANVTPKSSNSRPETPYTPVKININGASPRNRSES